MPGYPWKAREIGELRKLYRERKLTAEQIGKRIGRSRNSVIGKAQSLGLRRGWSENEIAYLKKSYPDTNVPMEIICRTLDRARTTIYERAVRLGLQRNEPHRIWSADDMAYLKEHISDPIGILSEKLKRSHRSIWERARGLGLVNGKKIWHHDSRRARDRRSALQEHGYRCMVDGCVGFERVVEVHHAPNGKLWVLCPGHHKLVTRHYAKTDGDKYTLLDC